MQDRGSNIRSWYHVLEYERQELKPMDGQNDPKSILQIDFRSEVRNNHERLLLLVNVPYDYEHERQRRQLTSRYFTHVSTSQ